MDQERITFTSLAPQKVPNEKKNSECCTDKKANRGRPLAAPETRFVSGVVDAEDIGRLDPAQAFRTYGPTETQIRAARRTECTQRSPGSA